METENLTVDPLARVKEIRFTDLTRAGKAKRTGSVGLSHRSLAGAETSPQLNNVLAGRVVPPAPDSQNPFRFLIARAIEKPDELESIE